MTLVHSCDCGGQLEVQDDLTEVDANDDTVTVYFRCRRCHALYGKVYDCPSHRRMSKLSDGDLPVSAATGA